MIILYSMILIYYELYEYDMTHRATITLDDESFAFLNNIAGDNRSAYINELLKQERNNYLKQALLKANQEEAQDSDYQKELKEWDTTLSDGLHND